MKEKVLIIGGGISGLSAGIYAQMNGFDSEIYEQHIIAGGECTSWKRKGYRIDGCINWLTGTKQGTAIHEVWQEAGAFADEYISYPEVFSVTRMGDKSLYWYRDIEKLKSHLLELSPDDKLAIEEMYTIIMDMQSFNIPAKKSMDIMNVIEKISFIKEMMPAFKKAGRIQKLSLEEYTASFKSPVIRAAIESFVPKGYTAMPFFTTAAMFAAYKSGWLQGGSQALADNMLHKYEELGGIFHGGNGVKRILVDNGSASAIELENGERVKADYVIPACDTYVTMKKLLENKYRDKQFDIMYSETKNYETCSIVHVAFGVDCDLSKYPDKMNYIHTAVDFCGEKLDGCSFEHFCKEKSFAPEGKTIIKTGFSVYNYDFWRGLSKEQYKNIKGDIEDYFTAKLMEYFPETVGKIEMIDVATPLTYERYCNAYRGSYMAFKMSKSAKITSHYGKIKGIDNMYIASQWIMIPGGLPTAVIVGKAAIQKLCIARKQKFIGVQ